MDTRVFIAVNLPEGVRKKLFQYTYKWNDLPAKWTKQGNLHITLIFLGTINAEELLETINITKEVALNHEQFDIVLDKIFYGPPKKIPPRMVWISGKESMPLTLLKNDLENALLGSGKVSFTKEERKFSPHITLGRIETFKLRGVEEMPEVNEDISFSFPVSSIEVMGSRLKRGGPEYEVLESIPLKD